MAIPDLAGACEAWDKILRFITAMHFIFEIEGCF